MENSTFQGRLRRILDERDVSEYKLAKELKIPLTTVNSWFVKRTKPREKLLRRIAEHLGVPEAWLSLGDIRQYPSYKDDAEYLVKKLTAFGEKYPKHMKRLARVIDFVIKLTEAEEAEENEEQTKKMSRSPKDKPDNVRR